jgi:hypothetical protein
MAEAGEVDHWSIVDKFNEQTNLKNVTDLVAWALPIQRRHFEEALDASLKLAAEEDPNETEE